MGRFSETDVRPGQLWRLVASPTSYYAIPLRRKENEMLYNQLWYCYTVRNDGKVNVRVWMWPDGRWELVNDV